MKKIVLFCFSVMLLTNVNGMHQPRFEVGNRYIYVMPNGDELIVMLVKLNETMAYVQWINGLHFETDVSCLKKLS